MSKKKAKNSGARHKGKVCPQCKGEGVVVEICSECQAHGCMECEGQGYIALECDTCGDPENRRIPSTSETRQGEQQTEQRYPAVLDPGMVGKYPIFCNSGGGTLYKSVLEYRVWVHSGRGDDVCRTFANYQSAKEFSDRKKRAEQPLALVLQNPWICWNDKRHDYELIHEDRIAEWCMEWLVEDIATGNPEDVIVRLRREHPDGRF